MATSQRLWYIRTILSKPLNSPEVSVARDNILYNIIIIFTLLLVLKTDFLGFH